MENLCIFQ